MLPANRGRQRLIFALRSTTLHCRELSRLLEREKQGWYRKLFGPHIAQIARREAVKAATRDLF